MLNGASTPPHESRAMLDAMLREIYTDPASLRDTSIRQEAMENSVRRPCTRGRV